jgi:DNA-binding SARP family transcriptional activator/TolB-like protein/Flp pilus assembly protein TadD
MGADPQFQLQLLGGFCLRSTQSHDVVVISAKKARALLAYLAMQEPTRMSRERLATLLWPDRIDRQARQNLRQCFASLRQDLATVADDMLAYDGGTIGLAKGLDVDARQLRDLSDTDDTAALEYAATLYRGQFLSDLAMEGEEFRNWVSSQRTQLESAAGLILSRLASRADETGDSRKALDAASRLVAIDPLREDWLRLNLEISARHLARDQALMQARSFIGLLRQELDVEPETETIALIERIRAGSIAPARNRNISSAVPIGPVAKPGPAKQQAAVLLKSATPAYVLHRPATVSAIVAALVAVLVASLSVAYKPGGRVGWLGPASVDMTAIDPSTIPLLILPVRSETAETAQLAHLLTENVLTSLSRFSGLTVFDGSSAARPGGDTDTSGIRFAASGTVRRQGSAIHLNLGLSDTANGTLVWANDIALSNDIDTSPGTDLTDRIARDLQVQTTYAQARGVNDAALNFAATNQLVAKALTIQYGGAAAAGGSSAIPFYEEVLRRDPNAPFALIGIAAELITSGANLLSERQPVSTQAERLIKRALQINPRIERAYYWLGVIYLGRGQHDLALQSFDRALALNPAFIPAEAHAGFALVLSGRTAEGLGRIENALAVGSHDPNERLWLRFAGVAQLELGNDKQAIDALLAAASLAAPTAPLRAALASAYALTGQRSRSREEFRLMKELADPAALDHLLKSASRNSGPHGSRYLEGLRLASLDTP